MERKPVRIEKVTPEPYLKVNFDCSNRAFYGVKNDVYNLSQSIGVDYDGGVMTEKCDYEGDLEKIIIYSETELYAAVAKYYGVDPQGLDIHLVCI